LSAFFTPFPENGIESAAARKLPVDYKDKNTSGINLA
jgi:hypothetical protein